MTNVHAEILIGVNGVALTYNEAAKRPVTLANRELATAGVGKFVQTTHLNFKNFTHPRSTALL